MIRANSFKLLGQAFKSAKEPMWASVQVLIVLTVILATVFFIAEYRAQPEEYNYGRSLLWAFTRYVGDPGKFAGPGPITFTGRLVACLIGIVGILIFAVPAGLVGAGFRNAIENELRKKHLDEVGKKLKMAFSRRQDPKTMFRYVPRHILLTSLQAQKNMTEKDVIEAVEYNPPFRLRDLSTAATQGSKALGQLAVEMFPYNVKYGFVIDRGSNITIACPSSVADAGIGNLGYYLALIGGFNYISKEIEEEVHEPVSFYLVDDGKPSTQRDEYLKELKSLSNGKDKWTIFLISSERESEFGLHFITKANAKTGRDSTIIDEPEFEKLYATISEKLKNNFGIRSELDTDYRPAGPKNIAVKIGGGIDTNAFTLRISSEIAVWEPRYIQICKEMAEAINKEIGDESAKTGEKLLKEPGLGYQLQKI